MTEQIVIHQCCGCSCNVCENGHRPLLSRLESPVHHTDECFDRFQLRFKLDNLNLSKSWMYSDERHNERD